MARLFSKRFSCEVGVNGNGITTVVPAGHVYVVKQLTFYANPVFGPLRAFFRDLGSGATVFAASAFDGTPNWEGFYGAIVFPAGASFRWETATFFTDAADVSASGYDLTTP
jgi:hypothetical protein